ncbi:hypothetical protein D9619_012699 [Psilocybe cf. subviscida]|uniref:Uncharacterized protein n=1 Tax=Psilocybe cf. subviscida TaxID=2480587 RepID=A0A8H5AQM6_9AGAR|nr:hypothetical protein D9619_012699 [Psilocybe cf. subviscida]
MSQQGESSSTGGQNVKTSLKTFASGGNRVGYSEYLGEGQPKTSYGYEGDVYVDLTPGAMGLYGHDGNRWIMWSGPSSNSRFSHPKDSNRWLWCNGKTFGWLSKNSYTPGHTQSQLLASAFSKKAEGPKKRKSYDAGSADHQAAAKKPRAEARENSTVADSESHWSPSTSVGPMLSATLNPTFPPPNSAARPPSYSELNNTHSCSFPSHLQPDEKANLLREINDLRVASAITQRQLAEANEQISQLQADNDALRQKLSISFSRILTGAGIPFSNFSSMIALDSERPQRTPPPRAFSFSFDQSNNPSSSSHTKPLAPIAAAPVETNTLNAGEGEPDLTEQRALLKRTKVLIATAHSQLDEFAAADEAEGPHQPNEGGDDHDMASVEEQDPTHERKRQSDVAGVGEELLESGGEGVDEEPAKRGEELAGAATVGEQPPVEGVDSDPSEDEDDSVEADKQKDSNSQPEHDERRDDMGDDGEGQDVNLDEPELGLDNDADNVGLLSQWDTFSEPVSEENEDRSTDIEEDQLFTSQADINPDPEDDDGDIEDSAPSGHAKAAHVAPEAILGGHELDTNHNKDMDARERSTSPVTPDLGITCTQAHKHDDCSMQDSHSIPVEQIQGPEANDLDKDGGDILHIAVTDAQSPDYGLGVTNSPYSGRVGSDDSGTGGLGRNVNQGSKAVVDDLKETAIMRDKTRAESESSVQLKADDSLPEPGEESVTQPQLLPESPAASPPHPSSWISQIPLPILFAKTKKYQLCRFCLTATPQIITKFPLQLDLPAMEAHCNEKHEEYCAILLDLSPRDLQGLLDADNST